MLGLLHSILPTLVDSGSALAVDSPLVLGPIAAFIFTVFVSEIVVSGKAYKREVDENTRLRALVEKVVPLAEKMVTATVQVAEVTDRANKTLEEFLHFMGEDSQRSYGRR